MRLDLGKSRCFQRLLDAFRTTFPKLFFFSSKIPIFPQVRLTRQSQMALRTQMESLSEQLRAIADTEAEALCLQPYAKVEFLTWKCDVSLCLPSI